MLSDPQNRPKSAISALTRYRGDRNVPSPSSGVFATCFDLRRSAPSGRAFTAERGERGRPSPGTGP